MATKTVGKLNPTDPGPAALGGVELCEAPPKRGRSARPSEYDNFLQASAAKAAEGAADKSWGRVPCASADEAKVIVREVNRAGRNANLKVSTTVQPDGDDGRMVVYIAAQHRQG